MQEDKYFPVEICDKFPLLAPDRLDELRLSVRTFITYRQKGTKLLIDNGFQRSERGRKIIKFINEKREIYQENQKLGNITPKTVGVKKYFDIVNQVYEQKGASEEKDVSDIEGVCLEGEELKRYQEIREAHFELNRLLAEQSNESLSRIARGRFHKQSIKGQHLQRYARFCMRKNITYDAFKATLGVDDNVAGLIWRKALQHGKNTGERSNNAEITED